MNGGQRTVVTGVHRLEHVQRFTAAALTDDDAIGPHTQGVDHQLANRDATLAVDVGWTRLEPADVLLVELQLCGVFDRDDALVDRDEPRAHIEESRLSGTGPARHQDVGSCEHARLDEGGGLLGQRPEPDQVGDLVRILAELSNRENRTVQRHRRDGRVDAGSVEQARIHERCAGVDSPPDRGADGVDDPHEMGIVVEADVGEQDLALALDVDHLRSVDHDLGEAVVIDKRAQWAKCLEVPAVELLRDGCHAHVRVLLRFWSEWISEPIVGTPGGRASVSNRFDTRSIPPAFQTSTSC